MKITHTTLKTAALRFASEEPHTVDLLTESEMEVLLQNVKPQSPQEEAEVERSEDISSLLSDEDLDFHKWEEVKTNPDYRKITVAVITTVDRVTYHDKVVVRKWEEPRIAHANMGVLKDSLYEDFFQIFVSQRAQKWISRVFKEQDGMHRLDQVIRLGGEFASTQGFPHWVGSKKSRMVFGKQRMQDLEIFKDFTGADSSRMEHMVQLMTAAGVHPNGTGVVPLSSLKHIVDKQADGVVFMLTLADGYKLGLPEGWFQFRSIKPYAKGVMVVSDLFTESFINLDSVKIKRINKDWALTRKNVVILRGFTPHAAQFSFTVNGENRSSSIYRMESASPLTMSHQLGYLLDPKAKWGSFPRRLENNIKEDKVLASLPTEIQRLRALKLDNKHIVFPSYQMESLIKQFRTKLGKLHPFLILSTDVVGLKPGWYHPNNHKSPIEGNVVIRYPILAVGGAAQEVVWEGTSPVPGVLLVVLDPSDKCEVSNRIRAQLKAQGADSDGDMMGITAKVPEQWLRQAGLKITVDALNFKDHEVPFNFKWDETGFKQLWLYSLQNLGKLGQGDVLARDSYDLLVEDWITERDFQLISLHSANVVQKGASAYKKKIKMIYTLDQAMEDRIAELVEHLDETVGRGFQFRGALYNPARNRILQILDAQGFAHIEVGDDKVPYRLDGKEFKITVKHPKVAWKGGFGDFLSDVETFSAEMGQDWVTHIKTIFARTLKNQFGIDISPLAKINIEKLTEVEINGIYHKNKEKFDIIRGLVAQFIHKFPARQNIWAWMLDQKLLMLPHRDLVVKVIFEGDIE